MKGVFNSCCFLCFLLIVWGCDSKTGEYVQTSHKIHTNAGALDTSCAHPELTAPDFTLMNMQGQKFTLSDQAGKVVVLNHWATWCGPCIREIPDFIELQEELKDEGVLFVGIAARRDKWNDIEPLAEKLGINYLLLKDDGTFWKKYKPGAAPKTYIINRRGELAHIILTSTTKELLKPLLINLSKM